MIVGLFLIVGIMIAAIPAILFGWLELFRLYPVRGYVAVAILIIWAIFIFKKEGFFEGLKRSLGATVVVGLVFAAIIALG